MENSSSENDFEVSVEDGQVTITEYMGKGGAVSIPETIGGKPVTRIGDHVFAFRKDLTSVSIPPSVTVIEDEAFFRCPGLASVSIGEGVTDIGCGAFSHCSELTTLTIPESVINIGGGAFAGCNNLTSINIGTGVRLSSPLALAPSFSNGFENYYNTSGRLAGKYTYNVWSYNEPVAGFLKKIQLNKMRRAIKIGSNELFELSDLFPDACDDTDDVLQNENDFDVDIEDGRVTITLYRGVGGLVSIPGTIAGKPVTHIGRGSFCNDTEVTEVNIGEGVTVIGDSAFFGCEKLATLTIPESVTQIGDEAFCVCASLTSINIPESVTQIGSEAFGGCSALTTISIGSDVELSDLSSSFANRFDRYYYTNDCKAGTYTFCNGSWSYAAR
ncbi:MAG: hypothetical protein Ta2A_13920 [Treponemataceae bacterium]|nr:MAG: hypothetical protein Ta2A_13920 [Treponemataceae bacterium]